MPAAKGRRFIDVHEATWLILEPGNRLLPGLVAPDTDADDMREPEPVLLRRRLCPQCRFCSRYHEVRGCGLDGCGAPWVCNDPGLWEVHVGGVSCWKLRVIQVTVWVG